MNISTHFCSQSKGTLPKFHKVKVARQLVSSSDSYINIWHMLHWSAFLVCRLWQEMHMTHPSLDRLLPNGSPQTIHGLSSSLSWTAGGFSGSWTAGGLAGSWMAGGLAESRMAGGLAWDGLWAAGGLVRAGPGAAGGLASAGPGAAGGLVGPWAAGGMTGPWAAGGLAGPCLPGGLAWSGACNSASNTASSNGQISAMQNPSVAESTVAELL